MRGNGMPNFDTGHWKISDDPTLHFEAATCLEQMLISLDTIIRAHGDDEERLRFFGGQFVVQLTKATLPHQTQSDWSDVGTFFKFKGEPGISHLISEFKKRPFPQTPK